MLEGEAVMRLTVLLALLAAVPAFGQEAVTVQVGETKTLTVQTTGNVIRVFKEPPVGIVAVTRTRVAADGTFKLTLTGKTAGVAYVTVGQANEDQFGRLTEVVRPLLLVITVEGAQPPPPDPDPVDPPPVPPVAAKVWAVVVEETGERTVATAKVLGDLGYWKTVRDRGHNWRFYDKDSADAKARKYPQAAAGVGLPALLILDATTGKVLKAVKLPATTAGIDALLKEVTGK